MISWGKPNEEFFEIAMNRAYEIYVDSTQSPIQVGSLKNRKNFRVLHIGDSIHHDIAGKTKGILLSMFSMSYILKVTMLFIKVLLVSKDVIR